MIILGFQYAIIIFCGVNMQKKMKKELQNFSIPHRKLQQQFFKALVVQVVSEGTLEQLESFCFQITLPTVLFHLPALPVLFSPFFDTHISFQTGFIYAVFSLYPPIDTVAFMWIVSEYKTVLKSES